MKKGKKRIVLEFEMNTCSPSKLWDFIHYAGGLERWIADKVERNGNTLSFTWGTSYMNKDEKTATVTQEISEKLFRFKWDDDEDENSYCEIKIEVGEITNDCILVITDFAYDEDIDSLKEIWDENIELLHQTGL